MLIFPKISGYIIKIRNMENTIILQFVKELQSFRQFNPEVIKKAEISNINNKSSEEFSSLVQGCLDGSYAEDIDLLIDETINLL